ncbi:alpha,alpha-trehalase TreF [Adhaeribacter swui]|uniref:Alpha,alpha-trehalase TreF n=2 Tax=Adhaeribacter swui TaxID=2086471 RepID=A0A7G7GFL8_9BACT|nr:alpha,alpha-trehalase TreF [Adhaeribacter swui]
MVFLFLGSVLFLFSYLAQEEQLKPQEQYPELFKAVQSQGIFPDSKTFPDCIPVLAPALIREAYNSEKDKPDFDLKAFVLQNFKLPATPAANFTSDTSLPVTEHINKLWPLLTRQAINDFSSRIHLPNPYLVPGGRFREIYYWDSYFGMLGLQVNGDYQLIEEMVDNFTFLIESVGHIPNGNRSYYTTRSQPPFYALMLQTLSEIKGEEVWLKYGPALKKEYHFWMDGSNNLSEEKPTYRRSVRMPDGCILNRYWDDCPDPRPESYIEDVHLARLSDQRPEDLYRHIRAAAESGWDFSSRWFADSQTMKTIHTTDIIPVDLNALLYNVEMTLAHIVQLENNPEQAEHYKDLAHKRKKTLLRYCWSTKENFFMDYDMVQRHNTPTFSLAACFPLYFNMVLPKQANCVAEKLEKDFFKPGGLITTLNHTPEQWDAPNAWAPLQYISIVALRNYGYHELAEKIKNNWIQLNIEVFKATGKLVEKYNVENSEAEAGGGEYPLQDGFGWTNGVLLKLLSEGKEETTEQGKKDASEGATAQESVPASPA